jgi:hypothetical protein
VIRNCVKCQAYGCDVGQHGFFFFLAWREVFNVSGDGWESDHDGTWEILDKLAVGRGRWRGRNLGLVARGKLGRKS